MSFFSTERPVSSEIALENLVNRELSRREKMRILTETSNGQDSGRLEQDMKRDLEKIDKKADADSNAMKKRNELIDKTTEKVKNMTLAKKSSSMANESKQNLVEAVYMEMAYNACWVDDKVKAENVDAFIETFNNTVKLLEACGAKKNTKKTKFVSNVEEACAKMAKKASDRIMNEACGSKKYATQEELESIEFDLSDDESEELSNSLSDLGKEDIEKLVKAKVLSVVQDEKQKGEEKAADLDALRSELNASEDDDVVSDDDMTLGNGETSTSDETIEDTAQESFNRLLERAIVQKSHRRAANSLFEAMMLSNAKAMKDTAVTEGLELTSNQVMGAALQEAVVVYTILETCNTLCLYTFDERCVSNLKNHYRKLVNPF